VAVDRDADALAAAREFARQTGVRVDWQQADLEEAWPDWGLFDAVLVFNYLDRPRFPRVRDAVRQGGLLIVEGFLTTQREQGWGPTADAHLLLPGELARLVSSSGGATLIGTDALYCNTGLIGDLNTEGSWTGTLSGNMLTITDDHGLYGFSLTQDQ